MSPLSSPRRAGLVLPLLLLLAGCAHVRVDGPRELTQDEVAGLLPPKVVDRDGWAADLVLALKTNRLPVDLTHACSVIAVAEQESGVQANPAVPGLPAIAKKALAQKAERLGPLGQPVLDALLDQKAPGHSRTFAQRIEQLRTERDLDLLFRDILAEHQRRAPVLYAAADLGARLFGSGSLEDHNPVTTAGSMQVSVRFAQRHALALGRDEALARDELYTRAGGLLYGAARLWDFEADYDAMQFRFADYNAGEYSSRNAAFQEQLAELTGASLQLDGDLLAYDKDEAVASADTRSMAALRDFARTAHTKLEVDADARDEKTRRFEQTRTWLTVRAAWESKHHRPAAYARLPSVELTGAKLTRPRSTAWFAAQVTTRYERCLTRAPGWARTEPTR